MFNSAEVRTTRYLYRGIKGIPHPGHRMSRHHRSHNGTCGQPAASTRRTAGSGGNSGKPTRENTGRALRVDLTGGQGPRSGRVATVRVGLGVPRAGFALDLRCDGERIIRG
jgi:hypothetical protein